MLQRMLEECTSRQALVELHDLPHEPGRFWVLRLVSCTKEVFHGWCIGFRDHGDGFVIGFTDGILGLSDRSIVLDRTQSAAADNPIPLEDALTGFETMKDALDLFCQTKRLVSIGWRDGANDDCIVLEVDDEWVKVREVNESGQNVREAVYPLARIYSLRYATKRCEMITGIMNFEGLMPRM